LNRVKIFFLGNGPVKSDLIELANKKKLENVIFLDRVNPEEVGDFLNDADLLLIHLKDTPLFRITIPSKTQSYLMMGRPILAGISGDASDLIIDSGGGVTFNPGDVNDFINKLKIMSEMSKQELDSMGEKGRSFYYQNLDIKVGVKKFVDVFKTFI
jgi:glycosyltransferase involved in cell wall biosynthesis